MTGYRSVQFLRLICFITISALGASAYSAMGIPVETSKLPGQVCSIEFYDEANNLVEVCSSTLVSPETILTAAHCLDKRTEELGRHLVKCPNGESRKIIKHRFSSRYPGLEMMKNDQYQRRFDSAVARLDHPVAITGMKLVTSLTEASRLISSSTYCAVFGYGGQSLIDPREIVLQGVKLNASSIRIESHKPIVIEAENGWYSGLVEPGDSGGPLACLLSTSKSEHAIWILIGNITGRDMELRSFIAPFAVNQELIKSIPTQSTPEAQEGESKFRLQQMKLALLDQFSRHKTLFKGVSAESLNLYKQEVLQAESEEELKMIERRFNSDVRALLIEFIGYSLRLRSFARVELNFSTPEMIELASPGDASHYIPENNPFSLADEPINWLTIRSVEGGFVYGDLAHFGYGGVFPCRANLVCHAGTYRQIKVAIEDLRIETLRQ